MISISSYWPFSEVGAVSGKRQNDMGSVYELEAKIVPDCAKTTSLALGADNVILVWVVISVMVMFCSLISAMYRPPRGQAFV